MDQLSAAQRFQEHLDGQQLKFTYEREQVLDAVMKSDHHFDADQLYESLKVRGLRISRDTVYRTIPLLLECGVLQKSVGEGKREYFERTAGKGHHDHMVCLSCNKVLEFCSDEIEKLQEDICQELGFDLVFHDHRLYGRCEDCQKRGN